jgi:NAD(P)-dependent dehydrogenase (short-subunit alcohol dehydrogenase family)
MKKKKITLVVGASRGIGLAVADHFKRKGDDVVTCARSGAVSFHCDVANSDANWIVHHTIMSRGTPDRVIHCAGLYDKDPRDVVLVNVWGAYAVAKAACEAMRVRGGSVVLFSGGGVGGPQPGKDAPSLYVATKAAVVQLVECLAREFPNVRVNAVAPGPVDTGLTDHGGDGVEKTVAFIDWLCDSVGVSGRLLSVTRDKPEMWQVRLPDAEGGERTLSSDAGRLRRVLPLCGVVTGVPNGRWVLGKCMLPFGHSGPHRGELPPEPS